MTGLILMAILFFAILIYALWNYAHDKVDLLDVLFVIVPLIITGFSIMYRMACYDVMLSVCTII